GVGSGWVDGEFAAVGVPKAERGPRTDEAIRLMRALWAAEEPISFDGRFWRLDEIVLASHPSRPGGPPIMIGGNSDAALRRAGRLGDGWLGFEVFLDGVADKREAIARAAEEAGRDPA